MFKKIIKGSRKHSKSDSTDASSRPPRSGNTGSDLNPNLVVNHASRPGQGAPPSTNSSSPMVPPPMCAVEPLPLLRDTPVSERQNLFMRKLQICCFLFDFTDVLKSAREKEIKRQTLLELVDYIQSGSGKITEICQEEMIKMVGINIFRSLPPASHENTGQGASDPEEEEPYLDPTWPHLQIVYELLLRYVVSSDTDTKVAKKYIDHSFILKLLDLFDSEDPREREFLKTILHRIYEFQRCMVPLFRQIARCLNSFHFQVAERALFLWNNEHIVNLIALNRQVILPIIFEALERNIHGHWNQAVHGLTMNVRKMFMEMDADLFDECQREFAEKEARAQEVEEQREMTWKKLADVAAERGDNMLTVFAD
ncbi:hypothetical protein GOBAR_DD34384 [Gossypium barbadense]|nr:hypothetical protein GOBAR_DD34384 [Gossypium barbadense]